MIPIRLSVQGLYSYQDVQEIDFQRLIGSSVFGIFGKVGSGKTSLLEAISFALYGKTERLNNQDNRLYNMMNLKSKELKIDFEFQAGADQNLYRFIYEAKRHDKKHNEVKNTGRRCFIWKETDWHPIGNEKEDVSALSKQILGLDYENFKRTLIIPQNQFREFLELSPAERTKMMNQLFKLDQYDLAGRVSKLNKLNENQLAELRGLLRPLDAVTLEAIDQAKTEIETIQQAVAETIGQIGEREPLEKQLTHLKKQSDSLVWARGELERWLTHEPKFQRIQQDIRQYENCRLLFQADLAGLDKLKNRQSELTGVAQKTQHQLDTLAAKLPAMLATYQSAKTVYENRESIQKRLDELDTVQQIRTLQDSVEKLTKNQMALAAKSGQHKTQIEQYKADRKKHQAVIDKLFEQESNLERLYKVQNWFGVYTPLNERANTLQQRIDDYDAKITTLKQRKDDALTGFPPDWAAFTLKTLPNQIEKELDHLTAVRSYYEDAYQKAVLQHELQRYANNLTDGTPCPLCGSIHHPAKHEDTSTDADVLEAEALLKKVRQQIDDTAKLQLTINGLATELRAVFDNGKQLTAERTDVVGQLTAHEDKFFWPEFTVEQEQAVTDAIKKEGTYQKQLQDAQKAVRELVKQIEEADEALTTTNNELAVANTDIAGVNGQITGQIDSLEHYTIAEVAGWDLGQIDTLRQTLTRQYAQAKTDFDDAETNRNKAEKEQVALQEQVQQQAKQAADVADDINAQEETIQKNLIESGLIREQVEQILRSNLDVEQEKKRVSEYDEKLIGYRKLVTDLETELANQPFDPDALTAIQEQLTALRDQKDALNKDLGKAGNVLATLEQQWLSKQVHQQRYDELDLRQQDLDKMAELFRKQGFVDYVSSVYLKNLCESANQRFFKLTNNQLRLELDNENNFLVRDFLNGGEVRSVKTLSGGQTFQASLSLALALSDNIQHLTKAKQNLFFLDEGFGTLDKDSLQTVFKTLKALRAENRVVGIISHVEELQQEVDTYIRTEATENGSRIIRSWE